MRSLAGHAPRLKSSNAPSRQHSSYIPANPSDQTDTSTSSIVPTPLQQLEALRRARTASLSVLKAQEVSQVLSNLEATQQRLAERLSDVSTSRSWYEREQELLIQHLDETLGYLAYISQSAESLFRAYQAANTLQDVGPDLERLVEATRERLVKADTMRHREVHLNWYGVATEVVLKGSFDEWTEGFTLSPESISDAVFTKFEATIRLRPGRYFIKFLIDGEWRLAPEWPVEKDPSTNSDNNVLIVE